MSEQTELESADRRRARLARVALDALQGHRALGETPSIAGEHAASGREPAAEGVSRADGSQDARYFSGADGGPGGEVVGALG